jgi:hypothetical protein
MMGIVMKGGEKMIKLEKTEVVGWEHAIRGMYDGKGVRRVYGGNYEAYVSSHGKFLSCGTYPTEGQAKEAVVITKLKLFEAGVLAHGDNPKEVVESVEKGYFVSPNGNIYNRHGDIMVGAVDRCGYRHVILNRKQKNVHRVIAETFVPNPNNLPCVNHKDGDKQNNSADNLEWCTKSENTLHSFKTGLQKKVTNQYGTFEVKKYVNQN